MATFAFITEGITDQIIIENILCGYFKTYDIDVHELQPIRDETDKFRAENYGGWKLVFDYCESDDFKEAIPFHDYIIIQIDTDVCEEKHYDVSKRDESGKELSSEELIEKVKNKIIDEFIGKSFFQEYKEKILGSSTIAMEMSID